MYHWGPKTLLPQLLFYISWHSLLLPVGCGEHIWRWILVLLFTQIISSKQTPVLLSVKWGYNYLPHKVTSWIKWAKTHKTFTENGSVLFSKKCVIMNTWRKFRVKDRVYPQSPKIKPQIDHSLVLPSWDTLMYILHVWRAPLVFQSLTICHLSERRDL